VTYSPTEEDLEWTQSTIEGRIVWAIPSIGCVFLFNHITKDYKLFMKAEHTDSEIRNLDRIELNLSAIGYCEDESNLVGGARTAEDIIQMLKILTESMADREELTEYWHSVKRVLDLAA